MPLPLAAAVAPTPGIGSTPLWVLTIGVVLALVAVDFALTRRPHEVSMREALAWSVFYLAVPLAFAGYVWSRFGGEPGLEFVTGYLVERSLSVDNLFVFMLLLSGFAVPAVLQQRALLYGIAAALVLRGAFIAVGAAALQSLDWAFVLFGAVLLLTAGKILRDARSGGVAHMDVSSMRSVRVLRRFLPMTDRYEGTRLVTRTRTGLALTPFAVVIAALFTADVVFAVDSIPAVYGITDDPYLVFATNAFALLGMRALYFVLHGALRRLVHLDYGLAVILAFLGGKLVLHWAHSSWPAVPTVSTLPSLGVIVVVLAVVTVTSLRATRRDGGAPADSASDVRRPKPAVR